MASITASVVPVAARLERGEIHCDCSDDEITSSVVDRKNVVVLKSVFPREGLLNLRIRLQDWARDRSPVDGFDGNGHRMVDAKSRSTMVYHAWWFCAMQGLAADFRDDLLAFFEPMRSLQNRLAGTDWEYERNADGLRLRPQVIQYPSGGGYFQQHVHPLRPQKLGLIVAMSQQGEDFQTGGTQFDVDGQSIELERHHDIGDIAIFRYDVPHGVSTIDPDRELDWTCDRGRWVIVLPIKET